MDKKELLYAALAFVSVATQMASSTFAFFSGLLIGASGFYNISKALKMFSAQWFGNLAFGQFAKFIAYYPFNWTFNFWQKTYYRGD